MSTNTSIARISSAGASTSTRAVPTASTSRRRRMTVRVAAGLAAAGAAAAFAVTGAASASAQQYGSYPLAPGGGACTSAQYASYQVRADFWATADGAKFKLLKNGQVVINTSTRATFGAFDLRSAWGSFPGPGYYTVCAQNTGDRNTIATMQLRTDGEVY